MGSELATTFVLIGVPDDRGVAANNGRVGAKEGPLAFRQALERLPGDLPLSDAGDIVLAPTNRETHERLAGRVAEVMAAGDFPLVIGGGHDNTYGGVKGVAQSGQRVGVVNIDAHLDLRPAEPSGDVNSGTPFRRLIEDALVRGSDVVEFGYQPHVTSPDLLSFAKAAAVPCWSWFDVRTPDPREHFLRLVQGLAQRCEAVAVTLDLDSIVATEAPGVSAPATLGFSAAEAVALLQLAAQEPRVRYLDLMELNPTYDIDARTARLAATLVWHFIHERLQGPVI